MEKVYNQKTVEDKIYKMWEDNGFFTPETNPQGKPFTIILPPPNANAPLHFGHAMMSLEDIMIRYYRMTGDETLFLPGADHAGFETQYVFEKNLQKQGKSRFDYSREELYKLIWEHVQTNRTGMENQLRKLGFSLDWSRRKFTMDEDIVTVVYKTFKKMHDEGLVYRGDRLVNYCTKCGTSFSDLEVESQEKKGLLYFINYPIKEGGGITIATTRPETMFGDVAVMVNPKDKRYKDLVGKTVVLPIVHREIPIIQDSYVDMTFGTGAVKVTPAHDFTDYEVGKRHGLPSIQIIGFDGRIQNTGVIDGMKVLQAREEVVKLLEQQGLLEKTEPHTMVVKICYKSKTILEPLPLPQWYVKVSPLTKPAIDAVKKKKIAIHPARFEKIYYQWLENLHDWNISRQVVWGIRIPAWRCEQCSQNQEVRSKNQEWIVTDGAVPDKCPICGSQNLRQDQDTFDTWFSSSQWPFATLMSTKPGDFEYFYPTSVMETGYDILKAWVSRMVMMGLYVTGKVPFTDVVLHGLVNDPEGRKMSKSKGNVVNPLEVVEQYGADALRFALVYGTALGNDQALSYPKLDAMRKFTNKLWNMGRFVEFKREGRETPLLSFEELKRLEAYKNDKDMIKKTEALAKKVTRLLETYDFNHAAQELYDFSWHEFADVYIEDVKTRIDDTSFTTLQSLYVQLLKLIHPFMPFITEEIYQQIPGHGKSIMIEEWPVSYEK